MGNAELKAKLDIACIQLQAVLRNEQRLQNVAQAWVRMSLTSTQKKRRIRYDK